MMRTTTNTRALLDLADKGEPVPKELAYSIAQAYGDMLKTLDQNKITIDEHMREIVILSKDKGELGMRISNVILDIKPEIEKIKKVVRLLVESNTTVLQQKMGKEVVDLIMMNPERFNADTRPPMPPHAAYQHVTENKPELVKNPLDAFNDDEDDED